MIVESDVADDDRDGLVVAQDPGGGTELEEGAEVTLTIGRFTEPEPAPEQPEQPENEQ